MKTPEELLAMDPLSPDPIDRPTGTELRRLRMYMGFTQEALAARCGLTTTSFRQWENNRGHIKESSIRHLLLFFREVERRRNPPAEQP